jgi:hypothetical protein
VPIPEPGSEQVLVRIEASGLCRTDIHAARGEWPVKPALPFIPGHEGVGIVTELGAGNSHGTLCHAERLSTALELGAEHVIHAGEQDAAAALQALGAPTSRSRPPSTRRPSRPRSAARPAAAG